MWMQGSCSRRGFGRARDDAGDHALERALSGIARRFNAAELDSVLVTKYPGFHVANVTLQPPPDPATRVAGHFRRDASADGRREIDQASRCMRVRP